MCRVQVCVEYKCVSGTCVCRCKCVTGASVLGCMCVLGASVCRVQVCVGRRVQVCVGYMCVLDTIVCQGKVCVGDISSRGHVSLKQIFSLYLENILTHSLVSHAVVHS